MKHPFIIYADFECLLKKKTDTGYNNHEKSSTTKEYKHKASGYSMFTHCSFDATKNKLDCYRGKDCVERFCKDLKEHATKIINYEKKEMIPSTSEERKLHHKQKVCYMCKKEFSSDDGSASNKKYHKVRDHCHFTGKYRGAAHDICNLTYKTQNEILIAFHNGAAYDYHFIIKELASKIF